MQRHSTMRVLFGAGLGAIVFAGAMLAATDSRAQEESPITKFLRGALSNSPDAIPASGAAATEQGAASDSSAGASATQQPPDSEAAATDDGAVNWSALNSGPPSFDNDAPVQALRAPRAPSAPPGLDVSRTDKPDGSASMALKHPLTTPWDTKVGADVSLAAPPATTYQPDRPLPGSVNHDNGAGGAWVSTDAPGVGTIGARVDARQDQRKLGTTFERSVPLGEDLSVTMHGAYAVTDMSGAPAITGSVPLQAVPVTAAATPSRVLDSEKLVKFNILPTGTSLGAGVTSTSTDSLTHHKLVAEQELYGPLHVTGTVTDMGQSDSSKSITAGVKFKW
jgi:hypothetical protein